MKIVINRCYGGYSLSKKAYKELGLEWDGWGHVYSGRDGGDEERATPELVAVVEKLGEEANGECARLGVIEIPDGIDWEIEEYDGKELVAEKHRRWG